MATKQGLLIMKVGDLVKYKALGPTVAKHIKNTAMILEIDDTHRQTHCTLLMDNGRIVSKVWDASLEVISESR